MIRIQMSQHPDRGHWDQSLVEDLFGDIDDNIILIPAKDQAEFVDEINNKLSQYEYCVVLIMSDEESTFPWQLLRHPKMKLWVQYPKDFRPDIRYLPAGYSPDTPKLVEKGKPRNLNWFFSGQITHPARFECAQQLRKLKGGLLVETEGFTQGMPREDYLKTMSRAKIIPCPNGTISQDTIRLYEALEAGCMPVVTDKAFFQKILGDFPFPALDNWAQFDSPSHYGEELSYEYVDCSGWWTNYKESLVSNMMEDLQCLKES